MAKTILSDIYPIVRISKDDLNPMDLFQLENVYHSSREDFVILFRCHTILLNKDFQEIDCLESLISQILNAPHFHSKTECCMDEFEALAGPNATEIMLSIMSDYRKERREAELYDTATKILHAARKTNAFQVYSQNVSLIETLFNIGYGIYDDERCDWKGGQRACFLYGYMLGQKSLKGED